MYLCYEKSKVAGATRDKYITYHTDTGRSAVYVSRPTATHCSHTRHNFLIHRGLNSRNLFVFPDFNELASWRIRIIVYIYIFFFLSITPSPNAVAAGMLMISRFILMIEPRTLRVDCLLQNPWRHFRTLWWWRHDELTSFRERELSMYSYSTVV